MVGVHKDRHGDWLAAGHWFDDDMQCSKCRTHWTAHQKDPRVCPKAEQCIQAGCEEPTYTKKRCYTHYVNWTAGALKRQKEDESDNRDQHTDI